MIQDLMVKSSNSFLDYFAQLGIFKKVLGLCGPPSDDEDDKVNECSMHIFTAPLCCVVANKIDICIYIYVNFFHLHLSKYLYIYAVFH